MWQSLPVQLLKSEVIAIYYVVLVLIGLVAGILGSILGLGGGVIMLPAVQVLLGFEPVMAVGTTMLAVVFTSFSGALGHFRAGNVQIKSGLWVGCGGLVGVLLGSYVFKHYLSINTEVLGYMLGGLFAAMTIKMGWDALRDLRVRRKGNFVQGYSQEENSAPKLGLFVLGFAAGCLAGMLGIGGGWIMTPGMMWLFGATPIVAVGTTLLAMLPIAILSASIKIGQGFVYLGAGLVLGIGTALGAQLGVYVSKYLSAIVLKVLFAVLFLILTVDYLYPIFIK